MSVVVGTFVIAATLIVWWRMPESRTLLQHWRVLLPFVVIWLLQMAIVAACRVGVVPQHQIVDGLGLLGRNGIVLGILVAVLLVFEAAWVSPLLLRAARGEHLAGHVGPAMRNARLHLSRMASALVVGSLPMLAFLLAVFPLTERFTNDAMVAVGLVHLAVCALFGTLSGAFVFEALERGVPFREFLRRGLRLAILNLPDWLMLFLALATLRGALVILPDEVSLHFFTLTGYGMGSHWFSEAVEAEPNALGAWLEPLVDGATLLLAMTIKLRIATSFVRQNRSLERAPS